jgi:hypothetical protein
MVTSAMYELMTCAEQDVFLVVVTRSRLNVHTIPFALNE